MVARDDRRVTVVRGDSVDDVVVSGAPERRPEQDVRPPRRAVALVLGATLLLAMGATLGLAWQAGRDSAVTAGPARDSTPGVPGASGAPARPVGLQVQVSAPATVVAEQPAEFVIEWQDDDGLFSGTSEDWGDGVGVSSQQQVRCEPGKAGPPAPQSDRLVVPHTYARPGTYTVVLGVTTYTCQGAVAKTEVATQNLTVQVQSAP